MSRAGGDSAYYRYGFGSQDLALLPGEMIAQGRAISTTYLAQVLNLPSEVDEVVEPLRFDHTDVKHKYNPLDHWA